MGQGAYLGWLIIGLILVVVLIYILYMKLYKKINGEGDTLRIIMPIAALFVTVAAIMITGDNTFEQIERQSLQFEESMNLTHEQIQRQNEQYELDNQPFVYASSITERHTEDDLYLVIKPLNVGKLPANVDGIPRVTVTINGTPYIAGPKINPVILYPGRDDVFWNVGLPIPGIGNTIDKTGKIVNLFFDFYYYAATDVDRENRLYYYTNRTFVDGVPYSNDESIVER